MATITSHYLSYADDKKIHHLAAGPLNGPIILFIHGWPATAITWTNQIQTFSSLGFRILAPDMPGYGSSTSRHITSDYSLESLVHGMMALLSSTGRNAAIWVGHDWGAAVTSSVATQYPSAVKALINICVPHRTLELGWSGLLPLINREIYPADKYEYGQWDYMKHYEENFEEAVAWLNKDVKGVCKLYYQRTLTAPPNRKAPTATVRKDGGRLGGIEKPPSAEQITGPLVLPDEAFESFSRDMQKTGFWAGCAYYMNHERNQEYNGKANSRGRLEQPVLFVHATWDLVCDSKTSRLMEGMRSVCGNLTEVTVESGHFLPMEKPGELNAAVVRFIVEEVPSEWPGFWDGGYTKRRVGR